MQSSKINARNGLPPFKGKLDVIEIVETDRSVEALPALIPDAEVDNARGDLNDWREDQQEFKNLATDSGRTFSEEVLKAKS